MNCAFSGISWRMRRQLSCAARCSYLPSVPWLPVCATSWSCGMLHAARTETPTRLQKACSRPAINLFAKMPTAAPASSWSREPDSRLQDDEVVVRIWCRVHLHLSRATSHFNQTIKILKWDPRFAFAGENELRISQNHFKWTSVQFSSVRSLPR